MWRPHHQHSRNHSECCIIILSDTHLCNAEACPCSTVRAEDQARPEVSLACNQTNYCYEVTAWYSIKNSTHAVTCAEDKHGVFLMNLGYMHGLWPAGA